MTLSLGTLTLVLAPEDAAVLARLADAMERIADALPPPMRITGPAEPIRMWPTEALEAIQRAITTAAPLAVEASPAPTETPKPKRKQAGQGGVSVAPAPVPATEAPTASRDVPVGTPWVFGQHRTIAEVDAETESPSPVTRTPSPTTPAPTRTTPTQAEASRQAERAEIERHLAEKGASKQPDFGDPELNALYPEMRARGHSFYKSRVPGNQRKQWMLDHSPYFLTRTELVMQARAIIEREKPLAEFR